RANSDSPTSQLTSAPEPASSFSRPSSRRTPGTSATPTRPTPQRRNNTPKLPTVSQGPVSLFFEDFGEKLALLKSLGATMRHMPKGTRLLCAQVLTGLIEEVTQNNSVLM